MKFQLVSDLHLEFSNITHLLNNPNNADVLILGGDILVAERGDTHGFLRSIAQYYKHIVYILGNHEYYGGTWEDTVPRVREIAAPFENIHVLDNQCIDIGGVTVIGSTLWTDMHAQDPLCMHQCQFALSDYRRVYVKEGDRRLSPSDTVKQHKHSVEYIQQVVDTDPTRTYVVVTHHCPTLRSVHPLYANSLINGAFVSDLSKLILDRPQIKLWTCGHTHSAHWYYAGETLVVCNPRGYETATFTENANWTPNCVIDLDCMPDPQLVDSVQFNPQFDQ